jgi:hypothetical protein
MKILFLMLFFVPLVTFSQNRDFEDEQRRREQNEKIFLKSKMSCTIQSNKAKIFIDPNITSDSYDRDIGSSWSFVVHKTEIIGGKKYLKGHLLSPRGGHQPEVGYIDPAFWDCLKR